MFSPGVQAAVLNFDALDRLAVVEGRSSTDCRARACDEQRGQQPTESLDDCGCIGVYAFTKPSRVRLRRIASRVNGLMM